MKKIIILCISLSFILISFAQKPIKAPNGIKSGNITLTENDFINLVGTTSPIQEQLNTINSNSVAGYTAEEVDSIAELLSSEMNKSSDILKTYKKMYGWVGDLLPVGWSGVSAGSNVTLSDGVIFGPTFIIDETTTLLSITYKMVTLGVYTPDNDNGFCLYKVRTSGDRNSIDKVIGSEILSSTMWSTNSLVGNNTVAFAAPLILSQGEYKLGIIYNNSAQTTAPAMEKAGEISQGKLMLGGVNVFMIKYFSATFTSTLELLSSGSTGAIPAVWLNQ